MFCFFLTQIDCIDIWKRKYYIKYLASYSNSSGLIIFELCEVCMLDQKKNKLNFFWLNGHTHRNKNKKIIIRLKLSCNSYTQASPLKMTQHLFTPYLCLIFLTGLVISSWYCGPEGFWTYASTPDRKPPWKRRGHEDCLSGEKQSTSCNVQFHFGFNYIHSVCLLCFHLHYIFLVVLQGNWSS